MKIGIWKYVCEIRTAETQPSLMDCSGETDSGRQEAVETIALTSAEGPAAVEVLPKPGFADWLVDSINGRPPGETPQLQGHGDIIGQIQHLKQEINNAKDYIVELLEDDNYDEVAEVDEGMRNDVFLLDQILKGVRDVDPRPATSAVQPESLVGETTAEVPKTGSGSGSEVMVWCPTCKMYRFAVCKSHRTVATPQGIAFGEPPPSIRPPYDEDPMCEYPFSEEELLVLPEKDRVKFRSNR